MENIEPVPPVQTNPQTESQLVQPSKNPKVKWISITGIVIVLIILSLGGTYLLGKNQKSLISSPSSGNSAQKTNPTPTSDPTVNWKTFTRNYKDFGISMRYPPNLQYGSITVAGGYIDYIGDAEIIKNINSYFAGDEPRIQFLISIDNESAQSYVQFFNIHDLQKLATNFGGNKASYKIINMGGHQGVKLINNNTEIYAIPYNDSLVLITAQPANSGNIRLFEQMMQTFKFTGQTSGNIDTSTWKIYTNSSYGYTFKYPPTLYLGPDPYASNSPLLSRSSSVFSPRNSEELKIAGYNITVEVRPTSLDLTGLENYFNQQHAGTPVRGYSINPISIANINGFKITSCRADFPADCVVLLNNSKEYLISLIYFTYDNTINEEGSKNLDQILSTFKFIQ